MNRFSASIFKVLGKHLLLTALLGAAVNSASAQATGPEPQSTPTQDGAQQKWPAPVMDSPIVAHMLFDQLEGRVGSSGTNLRWDGEGWAGTDHNRFWLKTEGFAGGQTVSDGDQEFLYDRPISRYFDAQTGVRADLDSDPGRAWAAFGIEGLAPFFFELAPTFYIRNDGRVAGRIEGSYDLYITQRWVLQPQAELNFYSKDDPGRGIGSGFSDLDGGLRLRYQISRKFSPYVGFAYNGKFGATATYARDSGEATSEPTFVFGIRVWR